MQTYIIGNTVYMFIDDGDGGYWQTMPLPLYLETVDLLLEWPGMAGFDNWNIYQVGLTTVRERGISNFLEGVR